MADHYSKFGPAPRPASCMLRSMLLSILHGTTSITKWVDTMRSQPLFALISGFVPDDVPGVGTFYDFVTRLWNSDSKNLSPHIHCKKTADERLQNYVLNPLDTNQPFSILFKIFEHFLLASHRFGLIDLNNLNLAGDGTTVVTSARPRSRSLLKSEISETTTENDRYFSQPDCDIGWDSSRNCYYSGYDLYLFTDVNRDLPIFPLYGPASKHDSFACLDTWFTMKPFMPYAKVNSIILDSAHDAMCYYKYFTQQHVTPYIDLINAP